MDSYKYINNFCTQNCIENLNEGKLQCQCGESGVYNWTWKPKVATNIIVKSNQEIIFHPAYSSGTAILRGEQPFAKNQHHFWEMKILSNLYGSDVVSVNQY